jgi:hypothetical protein
MTYRTMKLSVALLCAVAVSGCAWFRPAPERQANDQIQVRAMDGMLGLDSDMYVYAFHAGGTPMGEHYDNGKAYLAPVTSTKGVPILTIGRADGREMRQADKNEIMRVATFLCQERTDWARLKTGTAYPDWVENGRWHIVAPCD